MKIKLLLFVFLYLIISQCLVAQSNINHRVQYLSSTIQNVTEDVIELLDGSKWITSNEIYALPLSEIIIIFNEKKNIGTAFIEGDEIIVKHLSGRIILSSGYYTSVIKEFGDGAVIETEDGSLWEVPEYDRYDSSYWLPPYKVLITSNELYMYNLEENKRIWITRVIK
jgi:hypothetical protein